jgi:hypothetical protein
MSTRSNIILRGGGFKIYLYRHWDGYPAETGGHLLEMLRDAGLTGNLAKRQPDDCAAQFANVLVQSYRKVDWQPEPHFPYEVTTEIHGDIEHLYVVRFTNGGWVEIDHAPCQYGDDRDDSALVASADHYTLTEFSELVNKERAMINRRAKAEVYKPIELAIV